MKMGSLLRLFPFLCLSTLPLTCDLLQPSEGDKSDDSSSSTVYNKFVQMNYGPEYSSFPSQHDLAFFDARNGMTVGDAGSRFVTEDGGESWHLNQTGNEEYLERIFPIDSRSYVVGSRKPELFYVTNDTWKQIPLPVAEGTYLWDFKMLSDSRWYVTTGHFTSGEYSCLLKTENGGTSWDTLQQTSHLLRGIEILENGKLLLTVNAVTGTGIWLSYDDGKNWDGTGPKGLGAEYLGFCKISKLVALDNDHLLAVCAGFRDEEGALCTSSDGGVTWEYALCENGLENIAVHDSIVYICGAGNFVARWEFDFNHFSAAEIIADWHVYDPDTDFLYSNGKAITMKMTFTRIRAVTAKRIFVFVNNNSQVFRLDLE